MLQDANLVLGKLRAAYAELLVPDKPLLDGSKDLCLELRILQHSNIIVCARS